MTTGKRKKEKGKTGLEAGQFLLGFFLFLCWSGSIPSTAIAIPASETELKETVEFFSSLGDRSTGSEGNRQAAAYITERLQAAEPEVLDNLDFFVPIRKAEDSTLEVNGQTIPISPLLYNAITPENLPREGLSGPLIYVGRGELADFNGKQVQGAIILMEFD
ncbi:MAG: hypothetical protein JRF04_06815, partial [Deltaproteobacteria bacterium]|nr:hypothetical protein [Deltaproteobacteria bacterium]